MSDPPVIGCDTISTVMRIQVEWLSTRPGAFPSQIATHTTAAKRTA
jgi:hypothetical protein